MRTSFAFVLTALTLLAADVRLPTFTSTTLPNGTVVKVMPRHEVPLVTLRVSVRGGIESEPAGYSGLASVTADAIRRGTTKRTAQQFAEELEFLGGTLSSVVSAQATSFSLEVLAKDIDKGLDLLLDALLNPAFPPAEIKKLISQRVDSAKGMKDNPGAAASEYFRSFYYGSQHPYGNPADEVSLSRINRDDLAAYHKRMYTGRNILIVVVGDVDAKAVEKKLAAAFGLLPSGEAYVWRTAPPIAARNTRTAVIDKPDATQTNFLIGMPGISRTSPDRVPLWLVNTLFGGRFTSMLNEELRINTGLTYGANSRVDEQKLPGRITLSSFTKTETTGKAIDLAIDMLRRLRDTGISAEQLVSAKAYLKGTYPSSRLETADQLAEVLTEIELFGLNRGEVDDLFSRIDAVTLDQANQVARRYYSPEKLTLVLVGNAAALESDLKKYGSGVVRAPIAKPGFVLPGPGQ